MRSLYPEPLTAAAFAPFGDCIAQSRYHILIKA